MILLHLLCTQGLISGPGQIQMDAGESTVVLCIPSDVSGAVHSQVQTLWGQLPQAFPATIFCSCSWRLWP